MLFDEDGILNPKDAFPGRTKFLKLAISVRKENIYKAPVFHGECQDAGVTRSSASQSQGKPLFCTLRRMARTPVSPPPSEPKLSWDCTGPTVLHWLALRLADSNRKPYYNG